MKGRDYTTVIFPLALFAGLVVLHRLSLHTSQSPEILGRWSLTYAYLLGLGAAGTLVIAVFCVPDWRKRLLQRPTKLASRRLTWALQIAGLLFLIVACLALINFLPVEAGGLPRALVMLTLCALILPMLWFMHRSGAGQRMVAIRRPGWIVLLLPGLQLIQIALWIGLAPQVHRTGEYFPIIAGVRQSVDIRSFIMTPDRNADTWFNFFMLWPLSGYYMRLFGIGINQARFFYLLVSAMALPFIGAVARRLYGKTAAFCALAIGMAIPLQYNWALTHCWVATSVSIALYAMLRAQDGDRPLLWSFICGFAAVSAVEGHIYGGAFSVTFVLLWLWRRFRGRRHNSPPSNQMLLLFFAGCLSFTLLWAGFHIALPGTALPDVPRILSDTWNWETAISNPTGQVGLTSANIFLQLKIYFYSAPAELLLLAVAIAAALKRRSSADILLFSLAGGSLAIAGPFFAHVNDFYLTFVFPFFAIWFGAWLGSFFRDKENHSAQAIRLSGAGLFVLLATILLYALFAHTRSLEDGLLEHRTQIRVMEGIGREIDSLLPEEDVVVAGDPGYFLGMSQRLNYAAGFSFTWNLPRYWAFDAPQAVIVTFGVDDEYSGLDTWLVERDFGPAGCFSVPGLGDEVTILYLAPELLPPGAPTGCSPEFLSWPKAK